MKNLASYLTPTLRKWYVSILAIAAVFGIAMCCSSALAQSGAGSIQGTVTDSTGAVIQGASIHVVQQGTSATFDTKSSSVGFYQVPGLFTATYRVTVTAPRFKTYETSIELLVAQNAVINPALTPGAVTQQVMVSANIVQLTTTDSGVITSTLENSRINQLPMNGRLLESLVGETTPGLESAGGTAGTRPNGLMPAALDYVADGVTLTDRQFGGFARVGIAQTPDPDSVQEVSVVTSNSSAMYSEPATVVMTTKSGTNSLHGTMFETARNNAWGIAKGRQNPSNYVAPQYIRNEFGGSVGGPIILPHVYHGKDKTFWFFAYERYSLASRSNILVTVPTTAMRGGDFSGLKNSAGVLQNLMDPDTTANSASCLNPATGTSAANAYCRTQFDYNGTPNVINPARLSPMSKIMNDITPLPTSTANPLVTSNLTAFDPTSYRIPDTVIRFDHIFNENNRAYLRYGDNLETYTVLRDSPGAQPTTIAADGLPAEATGVESNPTATFSATLGYTHVFSPSFFAETVISQQWMNERDFAGGNPYLDYDNLLGLPNNFGETGFPEIGESSLIFGPSTVPS